MTNMNFGPEWMRKLAKTPSNPPTGQPTRSSSPPSSLQITPGGTNHYSYSSIAAAHMPHRQNSISEGLTLLDHTTSLSPLTPGFGQMEEKLNPFRYSKDVMLNLYKDGLSVPLEFERHEYVTVEDAIVPMSFLDVSEAEKKLLSGSVNSDVTHRIVAASLDSQNRGSNDTSGTRSPRETRERLRSTGSSGFNGPLSAGLRSPAGVLGRGRGKDYFLKTEEGTDGDSTKSRTFSRYNSSHTTTSNSAAANDRSPDQDPQWNGVTRHAVGTFDSNGIFRIPVKGAAAVSETDFVLEPEQEDQKERVDNSEETKDVIAEPEWEKEEPPAKSEEVHQEFEPPHDDSEDVIKEAFEVATSSAAATISPPTSPPINNTEFTPSALEFAVPNSSLFGTMPNHVQRTPLKAPEAFKWFYRDPSGAIQGPFSATDMHEWYEAGFFQLSLLVRREDDPIFDSLGSLLRKVGSEEPFYSSFSVNTALSSTTGGGRPSPLSISLPMRERVLDTFGSGSRAIFGPHSPGGSLLSGVSQSEYISQHQQQEPLAKFGAFSGSSFGPVTPFTSHQGIGFNVNQGHSSLPGTPQSPFSVGFGPSILAREPSMHTPSSPWDAPVPKQNPWAPDYGVPISPVIPYATQQPLQVQSQFMDHQRALNTQFDRQQYINVLQRQRDLHRQQEEEQLRMEFLRNQAAQQQQAQREAQHLQQNQQHQQHPAHSIFGWGAPTTVATPILDQPASPLPSPWVSSIVAPVVNHTPSSSSILREKAEDIALTVGKKVVSPDALGIFREEQKHVPVESIETETRLSRQSTFESIPETVIAKEKPTSFKDIVAAEEAQKQLLKQQRPQPSQNKSSDSTMKLPLKSLSISSQPVISPTSQQASPWSTNIVSESTPSSQGLNKGPSLREIQELEAREAETRKIAQQKAAEAALLQQIASSGSVDTSSLTGSWGIVVPGSKLPLAPTKSDSANQAAAWGKAVAPKKTLREIQQEEEEVEKRRQKLKEQQMVQAQAVVPGVAAPSPPVSLSKGYAGVVGVSAKPISNTGAWGTPAKSTKNAVAGAPVSSSAKLAVTTPQPTAWQTVGRSSSSSNPSTPKAVTQHVQQNAVSSGRSRTPDTGRPPSEEFKGWCRGALKGLNTGVNVDDLLSMFLDFSIDDPSSKELIQEVVYASSSSLDGRRFAEEFVKRRKADGQSSTTAVASGPLSANAKAPVVIDDSFKVVGKKGKGRKV